MKKNIKGFTLIELIVSIAILGLIILLSIPAIKAIMNKGENQKHISYLKALENGAKAYVDSYYEDLFDGKDSGCAFVTYGMLSDKNLIKDFQGDNLSCATANTFVRVVKYNDNYTYTAYMGCGVKTNNGVKDINYVYPESTSPHRMDKDVCGVNVSSIKIDVDKQSETAYKKLYDVRLVLSGYSGIERSIKIETAWSMDSNINKNLDFKKVKFNIPTNQKEDILNGNKIKSVSDTIITPSSGNGGYYLHVRVRTLSDLTGEKWKKYDGNNYLVFGPYNIDNEAPEIPKVSFYKWNSLNTNPGIAGLGENEEYEVNSYSVSPVYTVANSNDNLSGIDHYEYTTTGHTKNESNKKANYRNIISNGVSTIRWRACDKAGNCSKYSDEYSVIISYLPEIPKSRLYFWRNNNSKPDDITPGLMEYDGNWSKLNIMSLPVGGGKYLDHYEYKITYEDGTTSVGRRSYCNVDVEGDSIVQWKTCNIDGLCTDYSDEYHTYIDRSAPSIPEIKLYNWIGAKPSSSDGLMEYSNNTWTKKNVYVVPANSNDIHSGIDYYEYTTRGTTTSNTNKRASYRNIQSKGESYIKWRACDKAGNCSKYSGDAIIKIDRTNPTININNSSGGKWTNKNVSLYLSSKENESGISSWYYSFNPDLNEYSLVTEDELTGWVTYSNSNNIKYTANNFNSERNQYVFIRVCDKVNNCEMDKTLIKIDKTPPKVEKIVSDNPCGNDWGSKSSTLHLSDNLSGEDINQNNTYFYVNGRFKKSLTKTAGHTKWTENICTNLEEGNNLKYKLCDVAGNCTDETIMLFG